MKNNTVVVLPNPHEPNADRGRNPCLRHEGACNAISNIVAACVRLTPTPNPSTHTQTHKTSAYVCALLVFVVSVTCRYIKHGQSGSLVLL